MRIHQAALPSADVTIEAAIPVTSVERTLADIAATLDERQIERAVVAADRAGHLRWPRLVQLLDRSPGRIGIARLRRVVATVDPRTIETRSPFEIDFLALCRRAGLPSPAVNVLVEGYLVDFFWPMAQVIAETDGYRYHRDRAAFERDHQSTVALMAAGYTVHRLTYRMVQREPDRVVAALRRSLANSASSFDGDAAQT